MRLLILSALLGLALAGLPSRETKPGPKGDHVAHHGTGDHVVHHGTGDHAVQLPAHPQPAAASVTATKHNGDGHKDGDHKDDDSSDDHKGALGGAPEAALGVLSDASDPRFALNAIRIFKTERLIHKLQQKIHHADKVDPVRFVSEINARLHHLEDDECDKRHFQCGGNSQECINDLLVCDGHEDCHNGHDESDKICSTHEIHPGSLFHGIAHWTSCIVRDDHPVTLTVVGFRRSKIFTSRLIIKAHVSTETQDHKKLEWDLLGYYNYAHRRIVLKPDEHQHSSALGLVCIFNRGDDIRMDCRLVMKVSLEKCADIHFTREDKDAEDHIDEDDN